MSSQPYLRLSHHSFILILVASQFFKYLLGNFIFKPHLYDRLFAPYLWFLITPIQLVTSC